MTTRNAPTVTRDGEVIFRLRAPKAVAVTVGGYWCGDRTTMAKAGIRHTSQWSDGARTWSNWRGFFVARLPLLFR